MRKVAKVFAGPIMFVAGLNHFINPSFYEKIMPTYVPAHTELVYASGVAEMLGAAAIMFPRTRRFGGYFSIAVLLGIFPANVHMAMNPEDYPNIPEWALYARLPLQALFVYWVWMAALSDRAEAAGAGG
jgi:uncharacterized membrane protein